MVRVSNNCGAANSGLQKGCSSLTVGSSTIAGVDTVITRTGAWNTGVERIESSILSSHGRFVGGLAEMLSIKKVLNNPINRNENTLKGLITEDLKGL